MNKRIMPRACAKIGRLYQLCIVRAIVNLRIRGVERIEGFLSPYEAAMLYRFASLLPQNSIALEIGSWKGKSTYCLAKGLSRGLVIAIDPFDAFGEEGSAEVYNKSKGDLPLIKQFQNNMTSLGVLDKIKILRGYSRDFVGHVPEFDLLFIDGNHSIEACEFDYLSYSPYLRSKGYLLLHDFDILRPSLGPTWVVNNCVVPSGQYLHTWLFDSLWVGQKR